MKRLAFLALTLAGLAGCAGESETGLTADEERRLDAAAERVEASGPEAVAPADSEGNASRP
ncbi:MAG: hypothetical protein H7X93_00495 [Sphingomonadaceae bacterium]|nr:hypothetical protein [Sphingomonadaceae bacterium]